MRPLVRTLLVGLALVALAAGVFRLGAALGPEPEAREPPTETKPPSSVEVVTRSHHAMGTQVSFQAYTSEPERAVGAFEAAMVEIRRLEALLSNWIGSSDISRLNAAAGQHPVEVAPETLELLHLAVDMHAKTSGKLDVGFGVLADLWRFDHDQNDRVPSEAEIQARLPLDSVQGLVLDDTARTAFLPAEHMRLHLGGIGKGYAVDDAVSVLRARGLENFMIQAGGDLYAAGQRGDRPWRVGIRDPRGGPSDMFAFAEVEDRTFSTSGDYERFFMKDGVRYHHIIDPQTGRPARKSRSVTILATSAALADALSTAVFILGPEEGMALVEAHDGVGAVIVGADGSVGVSSDLKRRVRILRSPRP